MFTVIWSESHEGFTSKPRAKNYPTGKEAFAAYFTLTTAKRVTLIEPDGIHVYYRETTPPQLSLVRSA